MTFKNRKYGRSISASVACLSLLLSGCVSTQTQRIGADDGTDACRQYVVAMDATGNYFAEDMVGGALMGGLMSGNAKGALIGAASGAALGAAGGYAKAKFEQNRDKQTLYNSVMSDYDRELAKIDEADLAFKKLVECRNGTLRQVASDYQRHTISRDEAKIRWQKVLSQKENDLRIAEAMGKHMTERLGEFENASSQMAQTPWDAEQQAQLRMEQQRLQAKEAQEAAALKAQYDAQQAALNKAERAKRQKELDAAYARDQAKLKAEHEAEQLRLAQKKAGKVPTTTAQTHIQSYSANVAAVQNDYKKQVAVADNPDGFESALSPKTSWMFQTVPAGGAVIRMGALQVVAVRAA